ncbi:MAG TPA: HEAT repeat domain-containing protein, partial [Polyangiaceae bacterium]|nr:HEAT repeat domain-containing protein [Polyangiaceae bacterium]
LSFLKNPDAESVRWVEARYERGVRANDWNERHASAYVLGSLAEELAGAGRSAEARRINGTLQRGLSQAVSPREAAHALNALGATGRPENLPTILEYSSNSHGTVRTAAVFALGRLDSPEASRALVELVSDPLVTVQARAARALERRHLTNAELDAIARDIHAGALHKQNVRALVEIGKRHLAPSGAGAPSRTAHAAVTLLRAVLASGAADAATKAAIRRLIHS